jgi:TonB family protein
MTSLQSIFVRFEHWLERIATQYFIFWNRHKVGILGTIVLNLVLAILFMVFELKSRPYIHDPSVLVDFDREYEIKPEPEPDEIRPILPKDAIDPKYEWEAIRNIAVDATKEDLNPGLTDEKNIDADELYQDAQRIRDQMKQNREMWEEAQTSDAINIPNVEDKNVKPKEQGQFKGPSVISYFLEKRKALRLPVPAYKCEGGGRVVVDIEVLRDGTVSRASIDASNSVIDACMNAAAIDAAKSSLFNVGTSAPARQQGSITYLFVPQ